MDARILLVEDDADLRDGMAAALAADGHRIDVAQDGGGALEAVARARHHMLLLDVALGAGPDGVDVCRRVRQIDRDVYVMMLTARDAEADVVLALEAGADDYVTKPVGIAELRSRVRAVLRRVQLSGAPRAVIVHGGLRLDADARRVDVDGAEVPLTYSEF